MNKYIAALIISIFLIFSIITGSKWTNNQDKIHSEQFNSSNLNGHVEYFRYAFHGILFKLNTDPTKYVFYPKHDLMQNEIFDDVVEKGDIIVKTSYSDTLKLIKKGKVLLFPFRKDKIHH